jgi:hypothetical protein
MSQKKTQVLHATNAMGDHRAAQEALMQVNRSLEEALVACRALKHDARYLTDPTFKNSVRRLHSVVSRMAKGPNTEVWTHLQTIIDGANAIYRANND